MGGIIASRTDGETAMGRGLCGAPRASALMMAFTTGVGARIAEKGCGGRCGPGGDEGTGSDSGGIVSPAPPMGVEGRGVWYSGTGTAGVLRRGASVPPNIMVDGAGRRDTARAEGIPGDVGFIGGRLPRATVSAMKPDGRSGLSDSGAARKDGGGGGGVGGAGGAGGGGGSTGAQIAAGGSTSRGGTGVGVQPKSMNDPADVSAASGSNDGAGSSITSALGRRSSSARACTSSAENDSVRENAAEGRGAGGGEGSHSQVSASDDAGENASGGSDGATTGVCLREWSGGDGGTCGAAGGASSRRSNQSSGSTLGGFFALVTGGSDTSLSPSRRRP
ncbi:MAG: hypothetical protein U0325_22665 [Polyangiales bacterium]